MMGIRASYLWLILLIFFCVFTYFCLFPTIREYGYQKGLLDQVRQVYSEEELWKNYQSMKEEKEEKAKYLKGLENQLYSESQISEVVEDLQEISLNAQTQIRKLNIGRLISDKEYPVQNLKLTIQGGFDGILTFLSVLGNSCPQKKLFFIINSYNSTLYCTIDLDFYLQSKKRGE